MAHMLGCGTFAVEHVIFEMISAPAPPPV